MPIYEYQCNRCCHCYEELVFSEKDALPKCPKCSSRDVKKLLSAGSVRPQGIPTGSGGFKAPSCKPSG
ncbi:MAG: zinc ribbon domain-containing protein [Thermodesulfobacteriota bacterium]